MGFNHAGDEVWYWDTQDPLSYKICKNSGGQEESWWCSNTYFYYSGDAHVDYMGRNIVAQCSTPAPFGGSKQ